MKPCFMLTTIANYVKILNRCLKNLSDLENISGMDILSRYSKKVFNEDVGRIDFSILNDSRFLLSEIIKKMKEELK